MSAVPSARARAVIVAETLTPAPTPTTHKAPPLHIADTADTRTAIGGAPTQTRSVWREEGT